MGFFLMH